MTPRRLLATVLAAAVLAACSPPHPRAAAPATTTATTATTSTTAPAPPTTTTTSPTDAPWPSYQNGASHFGVAAAQPPLTPLRLAWSAPLDGAAVYAQPLVAGGLVIVATEDDDVYGLDPHDGSVVWKVGTFQEIDPTTGRVIFSTTVARRVPVFASPSAAEGLLLVPTTAGLLAYSGPAGAPAAGAGR